MSIADRSAAARGPKPPAARPGTRSKAEALAEVIKHEIVSGVWAEGDELPPEREVLARFNVSRPTYREAMRVLASQGLLKASRGARGGAKVLLPQITPIMHQAGAFLQMHGATLHDIFETRVLIEPEAVRLITQKGDQAVLSALAQSVAAQRFTVHDPELFNTEEKRFRALLLELSGSVTLKLFGTILSEVTDSHASNVRDPLVLGDTQLRQLEDGVRAKQQLIELMAAGHVAQAQRTWRAYIRIYFRRLVQNARVSSLELYSKDRVPIL